MTDQSASQAQNVKRLLDPKAAIAGNLTADPELRYTQNGQAVVNFTLAQTERVRNKQTNEFEDGPTLFVRCTAWGAYAQHIASSLTKGQRAIAQGRLYARDYTSQNGNGTSIDLDVDEVGPSLRFGTAAFTRA
ncbi:MAG: single-stranded DNA-binding protein, partial [Curtobacterium sp.]